MILSADKLMRDRLLYAGAACRGILTWTNAVTGEKVSSLEYELNTLALDAGWIRLQYRFTRTGKEMDYRIHLTTTPLPWGEVRWWFICPLVGNGRICGRRCGKLYLPLGARYYGCRLCYDLTYTSCQESHKYDRLFALLAADTGMPLAQVKRLFKLRFP
jgi:hypothetical protein